MQVPKALLIACRALAMVIGHHQYRVSASPLQDPLSSLRNPWEQGCAHTHTCMRTSHWGNIMSDGKLFALTSILLRISSNTVRQVLIPNFRWPRIQREISNPTVTHTHTHMRVHTGRHHESVHLRRPTPATACLNSAATRRSGEEAMPRCS